MIETERLLLVPLSFDQLIKYISNDNSLEEELLLKPTSREISTELNEALENTILPSVKDPDKNFLYSTLWTAILKEENKMVADLCFVGEPNEVGEIEIGYGTYEEYKNKGIMTEAVGAMIKWAKSQERVKAILASTDKSNVPSFAVLEKNQFIKIGETVSLFNWKLEI